MAATGGMADGLPDRRLAIAVTGHRPDRLGGADLAGLQAAVEAVLAAIAAAVPTPPVHIRLISGLAEGADSIAAEAALSRGWQLDAVLPFARDDYERDFEGEAATAFAQQLQRATAVLELPGERATDATTNAAYERAGRTMLAQADLLIGLWDGDPARGRGGAAQIIAEAVMAGMPVILIDPARPQQPELLWDGLIEVDLGRQTVETVARGDLRGLPALLKILLDQPDGLEAAMLERFRDETPRRWNAGIAYPLLLAAGGVRRLRWRDLRNPPPADPEALGPSLCAGNSSFADHLRAVVAPRFVRSDAAATRIAQLFRSSYVMNFALAALAVVLSLLGLALPPAAKPALLAAEIAAITIILLVTRVGNRAHWHRRWLDNRALAERLRCLALTAQLGDLDLRYRQEAAPGWVGWYVRGTAREIGLPALRIDSAYLEAVRADLFALIDGQIAYLKTEAHRMHTLEHRLHRLGTALFAITAVTCLALLAFKAGHEMMPELDAWQKAIAIGSTIISAALPAIGAAIYGIRMQSDFAGIAARDEALEEQLAALRGVIEADTLAFDTLLARVRRASELLTADLGNWLQTYHARPLALPG